MSKEYEKIRLKVAKDYKDKLDDMKARERILCKKIDELEAENKELKHYRTEYAKLVTMSKLSESDIKALSRALSLCDDITLSDEFLSSMTPSIARQVIQHKLWN